MRWPLVSCDPGVKRHALAFFNGKGELCRSDFWDEREIGCIKLAIEIPRIYPGAQKQKGDPNDIVDVAVAAGEFIGHTDLVKVIKYYPRQWKGQVEKPLCHHRIWQVLNSVERCLFPIDTYNRIERALDGGPYSAQVHNLLDAAGIGLFALGRHFQ